jgi:hypothetical protein
VLIRHLPHNTPAEDISDGLVSLGFDVVSVKQMTATRGSPPEESKIINLSLFLVTLPRTARSEKNFVCLASAILLSRGRLIEARMLLPSTTTPSSSATSEQTASSLPAACGAEAVTYRRSAPRKEIRLPRQHSLTVVCRKEKPPSHKLSGLQTCEGGDAGKEVAEDTQDYIGECVPFQLHYPRHDLHGGAPMQDRGTEAASDTSGGRPRHNGTQLWPYFNTNSKKKVSHFGP